MSMNPQCPNCGSYHVQLTSQKSKHGCLWFILFGWLYLIWLPIKWCIGLFVFLCIDRWMAIIKACMKKGYIWKGKRWFAAKRTTFYCYDCSHNFRG